MNAPCFLSFFNSRVYLFIGIILAAAGCSRQPVPGAAAPEDMSHVKDAIVIGVDELPCPDADAPVLQEEPAGARGGIAEEKEAAPPAEIEVEPGETEQTAGPKTQLEQMGILFHRWAFIESAGEGRTEAVELFILAGMDVNIINASLYGETALMWSSRGGHTATVRMLIENGADINMRNSKDMTALGYALMFGHRGTAALLRESGAGR